MGRITASRDTLKPDPRFGSILASKFINCLMHDGKKSTAQRVFYDALDIIKSKVQDAEPIDVFTQAVENVKPSIEVRSKRVGGAAYQVPMQVNRNRQQSLAIRWIPISSKREERPADARKAGRGTDRWIQSRRGRHVKARKRSSYGRREQGICPFRVVKRVRFKLVICFGPEGFWLCPRKVNGLTMRSLGTLRRKLWPRIQDWRTATRD